MIYNKDGRYISADEIERYEGCEPIAHKQCGVFAWFVFVALGAFLSGGFISWLGSIL